MHYDRISPGVSTNTSNAHRVVPRGSIGTSRTPKLEAHLTFSGSDKAVTFREPMKHSPPRDQRALEESIMSKRITVLAKKSGVTVTPGNKKNTEQSIRRTIFNLMSFWTKIGAAGGLLSVLCFVLSYELLYARVLHNDPCDSFDDSGIIILQCIMTIGTIMSCLSVFHYWELIFQRKILHKLVNPNLQFWRSSCVIKCLLEIAWVGVQCPPAISGCLAETVMLDGTGYTRYSVQMISLCVFLTRAHLYFRAMHWAHDMQSTRGRMVSKLYNTRSSTLNTVRYYLDQHWQIFIFQTIISWTVMAYMLMCFERPSHPQDFFSEEGSLAYRYWRLDYSLCLWYIYVIMTTVGLGDWYPLTFGGRVMTILANVQGLVLSALVIGLVSQALTINTMEGKALATLDYLRSKERRDTVAAGMISSWWRSRAAIRARRTSEHLVNNYYRYLGMWRELKKAKKRYKNIDATNPVFHVQEVLAFSQNSHVDLAQRLADLTNVIVSMQGDQNRIIASLQHTGMWKEADTAPRFFTHQNGIIPAPEGRRTSIDLSTSLDAMTPPTAKSKVTEQWGLTVQHRPSFLARASSSSNLLPVPFPAPTPPPVAVPAPGNQFAPRGDHSPGRQRFVVEHPLPLPRPSHPPIVHVSAPMIDISEFNLSNSPRTRLSAPRTDANTKREDMREIQGGQYATPRLHDFDGSQPPTIPLQAAPMKLPDKNIREIGRSRVLMAMSATQTAGTEERSEGGSPLSTHRSTSSSFPQ